MPSYEDDAPRLLLVEDDAPLARLVEEYLDSRGFRVSIESRGDVAARRIPDESPDLVILDILLPGMNGQEVCRAVRPRYDGPIIMLTALGEEADEVLGLEIGADDYIVKPVRPRVLLSRIQALLRRTQQSAPPAGSAASADETRVGSVVIDAGNRTVRVAGEPVDLTTAQFDLLHFLARRAGETLTRDEIYRGIRGIEYDGLDRSIDLRIARLRKKLGDDGKSPQIIKSVRGRGYIMVRDP